MSEKETEGWLNRFVSELDPIIFGVGVTVSALAVIAFILNQEVAYNVTDQINTFLFTEFSWFYLFVMFASVVFILILIFSPWGKIKLGKEDDDPEHSYLGLFVMLYSAGTAAGVVFWGPAEAIFHYSAGPPLGGMEGETIEAAIWGMQYSYFHWALGSWAAYLMIAIPVAYLAYKYDAPLRVSTVIAPIVGLDNLESNWAKLIDILAVFATIGGVATTLGFVGSQFLMGFDYVFDITVGDTGTILLITALTIAFTLSVSLGIKRGIRRISYFNMTLFAILTVAAFILGPTSQILQMGTQSTGQFIEEFVAMSFYTAADAGAGDVAWVGGWTIFFWAWWFSWAPFVGLFIARISKGRTIREVGVLGVFGAAGVTIPWYAVMGGSATWFQHSGVADILGTIGEYGGSEAAAGYPLFDAMPFGVVLMLMFLVLVTTFFITSADSSTLALGMLSTGGKESPSLVNRIIWGAIIGLLAGLLIVAGGIDALQAAAIITGGPFALVIVIAIYSMFKTFNTEEHRMWGTGATHTLKKIKNSDSFSSQDD